MYVWAYSINETGNNIMQETVLSPSPLFITLSTDIKSTDFKPLWLDNPAPQEAALYLEILLDYLTDPLKHSQIDFYINEHTELIIKTAKTLSVKFHGEEKKADSFSVHTLLSGRNLQHIKLEKTILDQYQVLIKQRLREPEYQSIVDMTVKFSELESEKEIGSHPAHRYALCYYSGYCLTHGINKLLLGELRSIVSQQLKLFVCENIPLPYKTPGALILIKMKNQWELYYSDQLLRWVKALKNKQIISILAEYNMLTESEMSESILDDLKMKLYAHLGTIDPFIYHQFKSLWIDLFSTIILSTHAINIGNAKLTSEEAKAYLPNYRATFWKKNASSLNYGTACFYQQNRGFTSTSIKKLGIKVELDSNSHTEITYSDIPGLSISSISIYPTEQESLWAPGCHILSYPIAKIGSYSFHLAEPCTQESISLIRHPTAKLVDIFIDYIHKNHYSSEYKEHEKCEFDAKLMRLGKKTIFAHNHGPVHAQRQITGVTYNILFFSIYADESALPGFQHFCRQLLTQSEIIVLEEKVSTQQIINELAIIGGGGCSLGRDNELLSDEDPSTYARFRRQSFERSKKFLDSIEAQRAHFIIPPNRLAVYEKILTNLGEQGLTGFEAFAMYCVFVAHRGDIARCLSRKYSISIFQDRLSSLLTEEGKQKLPFLLQFFLRMLDITGDRILDNWTPASWTTEEQKNFPLFYQWNLDFHLEQREHTDQFFEYSSPEGFKQCRRILRQQPFPLFEGKQLDPIRQKKIRSEIAQQVLPNILEEEKARTSLWLETLRHFSELEPSTHSKEYQTFLALQAWSNHIEEKTYLTPKKLWELFIALQDQGVDINSLDTKGSNALHYAVACENPEIMENLLEKKIDVNIQNNLGITALMLSVKSNRLKYFETLLSYGANFFIRDKENKSILSYAFYIPEPSKTIALIVSLLLKNHSPQYIIENLFSAELTANNTFDQFKFFLEYNINGIGIGTYSKELAFKKAIEQGNFQNSHLLLTDIEKAITPYEPGLFTDALKLLLINCEKYKFSEINMLTKLLLKLGAQFTYTSASLAYWRHIFKQSPQEVKNYLELLTKYKINFFTRVNFDEEPLFTKSILTYALEADNPQKCVSLVVDSLLEQKHSADNIMEKLFTPELALSIYKGKISQVKFLLDYKLNNVKIKILNLNFLLNLAIRSPEITESLLSTHKPYEKKLYIDTYIKMLNFFITNEKQKSKTSNVDKIYLITSKLLELNTSIASELHEKMDGQNRIKWLFLLTLANLKDPSKYKSLEIPDEKLISFNEIDNFSIILNLALEYEKSTETIQWIINKLLKKYSPKHIIENLFSPALIEITKENKFTGANTLLDYKFDKATPYFSPDTLFSVLLIACRNAQPDAQDLSLKIMKILGQTPLSCCMKMLFEHLKLRTIIANLESGQLSTFPDFDLDYQECNRKFLELLKNFPHSQALSQTDFDNFLFIIKAIRFSTTLMPIVVPWLIITVESMDKAQVTTLETALNEVGMHTQAKFLMTKFTEKCLTESASQLKEIGILSLKSFPVPASSAKETSTSTPSLI